MMRRVAAIMILLIMVICCATSALAEDQFAELGSFEMLIGCAGSSNDSVKKSRTDSAEWFAQQVSEKTKGHITVLVFPNGQLGSEQDILAQVVDGSVQGMFIGQIDSETSLLALHPSSDPFYVNLEWWNSLPNEFQSIITEIADELDNQ